MSLHYFLLVYDTAKRKLLKAEDLGTSGRAAATAYDKCEEKHGDNSDLEIVLAGADSLDTLRVTHSHYFERDDDAFADVLQPEPA